MKRAIIAVVIVGILFGCTAIFANTERETHINAIKRIRLYLWAKSIGHVSGYLCFFDSTGEQCSASSVLTVIRNRGNKKLYLSKIPFTSNDFRAIELRGGDVIYALPISFNPNDVRAGDIIIVQCGILKSTCRVFRS